MTVNLLRHFLVDGLRRLQFVVLPPHCLLCGQAGAIGRDLCDACVAYILRNRVCCPRCALPLDAPAWVLSQVRGWVDQAAAAGPAGCEATA